MRPIGVGIYPLGAMVNHSCTPNCIQVCAPPARPHVGFEPTEQTPACRVQMFSGNVIEFRAATAIKPGDELTISYIELAARPAAAAAQDQDRPPRSE